MLMGNMAKMLRTMMVIEMTDTADNYCSNEDGYHDDVRKCVENDTILTLIHAGDYHCECC